MDLNVQGRTLPKETEKAPRFDASEMISNTGLTSLGEMVSALASQDAARIAAAREQANDLLTSMAEVLSVFASATNGLGSSSCTVMEGTIANGLMAVSDMVQLLADVNAIADEAQNVAARRVTVPGGGRHE